MTSAITGAVVSVVVELSVVELSVVELSVVELSVVVVVAVSVNSSFSSLQEIMVRLKQEI